MKRAFLALLVICGICYLSCKEDQDGPDDIYGTWKLTETMSDPGNGTGKYVPVQGETKYLTITRSGKVEGEGLSNVESLKVLDSTFLEATFKDHNQPVKLRYELSGTTLTINLLCIEGCGVRFKRQ